MNPSGDLAINKLDKSSDGGLTGVEKIVENGQGDNKSQANVSPVDKIGDKSFSGDGGGGGGENHTAESETVNKELEEDLEVAGVSSVKKVQYSLSAVVCHVDDKSDEDRRNIVALIRVAPSYHERLTGSAVSQWYIFNDFW